MPPLAQRVLRARRGAVDKLLRARHRSAQRALAEAKAHQRSAWARQAPRAAAVYDALREHDDPRFTIDLWASYVGQMASWLLPTPPPDFLRRPEIQETMEVRGRRALAQELRWIRERLSDARLRRGLEEDFAGDPALAVTDPPTSHTAVHHVYHLERFRAATGAAPEEQRTVVEIGGGFGGFARTLRRLAGERPPTQVVVDLPLIATLQWTYLTTVFGEQHVDVATREGQRPRPGSILLVPPALAPSLDIEADLLVSLWGMSEMTRAGQDAIVGTGWLGARHLLLAFQRSESHLPRAERVGALVRDEGGVVEPLGVVSQSAYGFR